MIELQRNTTTAVVGEPLTWRPVRMPGRRWSAAIVCGNGHHGFIDEHVIAEDGAVSPSVVCTRDGCTWHEDIKLAGWKEGIEAFEPGEARR